MWSESTPASMREVAPPGRRERADSRSGTIPVCSSTSSAAWRSALVMNCVLTGYHLRFAVL